MSSAVEPHQAAHDAFNRRDWDQLRAAWSPDMVYIDHARGVTIHGIDDFIAWCQDWIAGFSDARIDDAQYLDAGGHSVCRFRGRGVNDGAIGPATATGNPLDLPMCEVHRVDDGRLTSGEIYYDAMSIMVQLGVAEPVAG